MPAEWAVQIITVAVQVPAIVLIAIFATYDNLTVWIITVVLGCATAYFTAMLVYKIYRARLSRVTFRKDGISFGFAFKRVYISAERVAIDLVNYGKPKKKKFYVQVSDTAGQAATFVELDKKRVMKLVDNAPAALPKLFVSICDTQTLKSSLDTAIPALVPYIEAELNERETAAVEARAKQAKPKNKKKHKK